MTAAETTPQDGGGRRFVTELFLYATRGFAGVSWWPMGGGPGEHRFVEVDEADQLFDIVTPHIPTANVYVRLTTVIAVPSGTKRGGKDATDSGFAIPIDLDPGSGWTPHLVDKFFEMFRRMGLDPTVKLASGNGWHGHLFYDEPFDLMNHVKMLGRAKQTFQRVAAILGKQEKVTLSIDTTVYEEARVMRLPGTLNVKDPARPLQCAVYSAEYDRRFSWSDLDEALDAYTPPVRREPIYTIGAADDPNLGAPGREFCQREDVVEVILNLFTGFHIVHVDTDNNVYIARHDRSTHGIVVYFADQHVAIYSETTRRHEMGIPAGDPDDVVGPWNAFNILAWVGFGGNFSETSKALAEGKYLGRVYGADARAKQQDAANFERLTAMIEQAVPTPLPPPQPAALALVPEPEPGDDDESEPTGPDEEEQPAGERVGRIDISDLLQAIGFTERMKLGTLVQYDLVSADGGTNVAATVQRDGTVVLAEHARRTLATAPVGVPLDWWQILDIIFPGTAEQAWPIIVNPAGLANDVPTIYKRIREHVQGVEGVSRTEPEELQWATADDVVKRPKPPAVLLKRTADDACLIYDQRISIVFGPSETTKTWLCAVAALDCIRRLKRNVAWFDIEEPGNSQGAYRLAQLGATPEEMRMLINLDGFMPEMISTEYGQRHVNKRLLDKLVRKMIDSEIALIIIDSFSELAGSQDLDDNQKSDVAFLRNHLINHLAKVAGVIIIDHTGHTTGAREAGSINKKNAVTGVRIYVDQLVKFSPGIAGEARLWVLKDRHSKVYKSCMKMPIMFDGEKKLHDEHLAGIFRLKPAGRVERTVSDDEYVDAAIDSPFGYTPPTPSVSPASGGRTTADYQLLAELERGKFTSFRNACARMENRFDTGKGRVTTLLEKLVYSGHIQCTEQGSSKVYEGVPSVYSKETKAAIADLKRTELQAAKDRSDGSD